MAILLARLEIELVQPVVYRGAMIAIARKPDNPTLFRLLPLTAGLPETPVDSEFWQAGEISKNTPGRRDKSYRT